MKRKLLILPLLIALLIVSTIPAFASNETTNSGVTVTDGVGAPGKEVRLTVSVRSVFADNVGLVITYDGDVLTLSEESAWLISGQDELSDVDVANGIAVWGADAMELKGEIFELVFLVDENAAVGATANVSCTLRANWNEDVQLEETTAAAITVKNLAKITGTVTSDGNAADPVTVELISGTEIIDTVTLENGTTEYAFEVEQGEYVVRFKKTMHCPRDYEVSMKDLTDKVQDAEIRLYGDITGDGKIQSNDATQITRYLNDKTSSINAEDAYSIKVADITKDGKIQSNDATQITRYLNDKTSSFDNFE